MTLKEFLERRMQETTKFKIIHKPPPINQIYRARSLKNGVIYYKTKEAKDWTNIVRLEFVLNSVFLWPTDRLIKLNIDIFWTKREPDIDAYLKLLLDTLEGYAYINDKQIVELTAKKHKAKNPKEFKILIKSQEI